MHSGRWADHGQFMRMVIARTQYGHKAKPSLLLLGHPGSGAVGWWSRHFPTMCTCLVLCIMLYYHVSMPCDIPICHCIYICYYMQIHYVSICFVCMLCTYNCRCMLHISCIYYLYAIILEGHEVKCYKQYFVFIIYLVM